MDRILRLGSRGAMTAATLLAATATAWSQPSLTVPEATASTGDEVAIKARAVDADLPPAPLPDPQLGATESKLDPAVAPKLSASELESLVAPIALQPDEVLDNILDAVQSPTAIRQAHEAVRDKTPLPVDLPAGVKYLADKHPKVLGELHDNILLMTRLGLAVKTQPQDVVAAIRAVRSKANQMASQANDSADGATVYSLPVTNNYYYGDGGVYAGTSYPCYGYYTYGLPNSYYGYGYGYPYYGYGYGYGYGYPYGWIARLTLGIIYAANGPYYPYYPYYGFYPWYGGYPYAGYYPWYGYEAYPWTGGYPAYANWANVYGPRGGQAYVNSISGYGPNGAYYRSGASTGTFVGPNGVGTFNAASNTVRFNNGTTAFAAGRGAATINAANGNTINVAGAGIAGKTTFGNTTSFGSAGALGIQSTSGVNALATHVGGGSVTANANGTYSFNRSATNSLSGVNGSVTTAHTGQGTYAGGGNGSYAGSTSVQGSGGRGGTVNTTFSNGDLDVNVTPNNPLNAKSATSSALANRSLGSGAANRLSAADGSRGVTNGLSSQGFGPLANLSNNGTAGGGTSGLRNFSSQSGSQITPRSLSGGTSAGTGVSGLGSRFGGYGNLAPNGSSGVTAGSRMGSSLGSGNGPAVTNFGQSSRGQGSFGQGALGQGAARSNFAPSNGLGNNVGSSVRSNIGSNNALSNAPRVGGSTSGFDPVRSFNPTGTIGSGSRVGGNFGSAPSRGFSGGGKFGGGSIGRGSIGGGGNFGGGSIGRGGGGFGGGGIGGGRGGGRR